jgi:hypothetical protein
VETGCLSRKEVILWNTTVVANHEVVLSSNSRRAVPDSHRARYASMRAGVLSLPLLEADSSGSLILES